MAGMIVWLFPTLRAGNGIRTGKVTCIIGKPESSISSYGSIKNSTVILIGSGIPPNQLELQISLSEYMWLVLETFNQQSGRGIT